MSELYDESGNPIEGFTEEETQKKLEEASEVSKKEIEELQVKIKEFEEKKGDNKEDNKGEEGKEGDKELNFKKLDGIRKDQAKEIEELKGTLKEVETTARNVTEQRINEEKLNQKIDAFASGDSEVAEKIKFFYNNFKPIEEDDPVKRDELFNERVDHAILLATGSKPSNPLKDGNISSFGGDASPGKDTGKLSDEVKEMMSTKMGISKEDIKKAEDKGLL